MGPFSPRGVRIDDPNDLVPHENRRTLRALRVLGAFVNLQEIRPANTLDVYEGEAGHGFVRHYFLDLGQAFGGYAAGSRRYWSGYNHYFSVKEAARNLATFGFFVGPWEEEITTAWPSVGTFEARRFEPSGWRETARLCPHPPRSARGRLLGGQEARGLSARAPPGPGPLRAVPGRRAPKSTW